MNNKSEENQIKNLKTVTHDQGCVLKSTKMAPADHKMNELLFKVREPIYPYGLLQSRRSVAHKALACKDVPEGQDDDHQSEG